MNNGIAKISSVLLLLLVCGIVFIGCAVGTDDLDDPTLPIRRTDFLWVERHINKKNNVINNQKIIFIGDSITEAWEGKSIGLTFAKNTDAWDSLNARYHNKITNLGFGGDNTQHVIWRLKNGEFPVGINPEYVVLMIGTNNSANGYRPEAIAAGISEIIKIVNRVSPSTKIILLAIFPRGQDNLDDYRICNNSVNNIIRTFDGHLNVTYYDFGSLFVEENGQIKRELFCDDLIHINDAGYDVWKDALIEIIG